MPSLKDIRTRIASVKSTQQITKAMKMVAGAKMRRAHDAVLGARPYAAKLEGLVHHLAAAGAEAAHPLLEQRPVKRATVIVMTSDRGLCGGFNGQLLRALETDLHDHPEVTYEVIAVGRKGRDFLKKRGYNLIGEHIGMGGHITAEFARDLVAGPIAAYEAGETDQLVLAFNTFKSAISQIPTLETILPVPLPEADEGEGGGAASYLFEPGEAALLADLLPRYVANRALRALFESEASEHSARMAAMDAATNNAEELIRSLTLTMNRARQAIITKEILEIVGGAEALASS